VCKDAKKRRKPNGWHKASKASITTLHVVEKGYVSSKPTPQRCISQMVASKLSIRGMDATTQASGLKDRQEKTHGRHKAWKNLDQDRKTWR